MDITYGKRRAVRCPLCGAEYSAARGDYWAASSDTAFTCEHEYEKVPCDLVQRIGINGTDDQGREYYGSGWVVLAVCATVADVRRV